MPIQVTNRKGKTYMLYQTAGPGGKPRYHFAQSSDSRPVETLPAGYEVYEHPNGQVYLRRARPQAITPAEVEQVRRVIGRQMRLQYYRVDVRGPAIVVYEPTQDVGGLEALLGSFGMVDTGRAQQAIARVIDLRAVMRFVLVDEAQRLFQTERYCFRGSIDDWIVIGAVGPLTERLAAFVRHLGRDSFFTLFGADADQQSDYYEEHT